MSEDGHSNTSFPRSEKMELMHKALEDILSSLYVVTEATFECVHEQREKLQCHHVFAELAEDATKQKDLSLVMLGCQAAKPGCRSDTENQKSRKYVQFLGRSRKDQKKENCSPH